MCFYFFLHLSNSKFRSMPPYTEISITNPCSPLFLLFYSQSTLEGNFEKMRHLVTFQLAWKTKERLKKKKKNTHYAP